MHSLNTLAQLKCFFMNQQYHIAKRTKGLLDYVPPSSLHTPLNLHPVNISASHLCGAILLFCKGTKNLCPTLLSPPYCILKGHCPTYLPLSSSALLCDAPFPPPGSQTTFNLSAA